MSDAWTPLVGGNQAADPQRLGVISGDIDRVSYYLPEQWTAFLLPGDIARGATPRGLQLPAMSADEPQTVSTRFDNRAWRSFRVYDRGDCSLILGYETLAQAIMNGIMGPSFESGKTKGTQYLGGRVAPVLKSFFSGSSAPVDADNVVIRWQFAADKLGTLNGPNDNLTTCDDVKVDIEVRLEQIPSDEMTVEMKIDDFIDAVGSACSVDDYDIMFSIGRDAEWSAIRASCGDVVVTNADLPHLGDWSPAEVRRLRWLDQFSGTRTGDRVLLSFPTHRGRPLNAHDTIFKVVDFKLTVLEASNCGPLIRGAIFSGLEDVIRRSFPLGLNRGLLESAVMDPWLMVRTPVTCEQDDDCSAADGDPAYLASDGTWQGARHVCRERDKPALKSLVESVVDDEDLRDIAFAIIDVLPPGQFCHVQLEPDHLSLRPDGLEAVLAYDLGTDPQSELFVGEFSQLEPLCAPDRNGAPPAGTEPVVVNTETPIVIPDVSF